MTARRLRPATRKMGPGKYLLDGTKPMSVTKLMNGIPKQLQGWAARSAAEFVASHREILSDLRDDELIDLVKGAPFRQSREAAMRGTDVHRLAAALAEGQRVDVPDDRLGFVEAYLDWYRRWRPDVELVETPIFNRRYHYAGTLDLVCGLEGMGRTLLDLKTNKRGEPYGEVAVQLAAYAHGEVYLDAEDVEHPMPPIESYACLWIGPDSWEMFPIDVTEREWRIFLYAGEVHRWIDTRARTVVQPPMARPPAALTVAS